MHPTFDKLPSGVFIESLVQRGHNFKEAAVAVANGGIIAYPTEGVFGLGCDPSNTEAIAKVISLKERTSDKGLILIAASREQLNRYTGSIAKSIEVELNQSWPGAVTWILPAAEGSSELLTGGRPTIAARVTAFEPAAHLCEACGHALISTSANRSGGKPCTNAAQAADEFPDLDYIVDLPVGPLQGPTPIFDGLSGKQLR